jgi:hypothetical protein
MAWNPACGIPRRPSNRIGKKCKTNPSSPPKAKKTRLRSSGGNRKRSQPSHPRNQPFGTISPPLLQSPQRGLACLEPVRNYPAPWAHSEKVPSRNRALPAEP